MHFLFWSLRFCRSHCPRLDDEVKLFCECETAGWFSLCVLPWELGGLAA